MDHHLLPASSPVGDFESAQPYIPDGTAQHDARPGAMRRGLHVDRDVAPVPAACGAVASLVARGRGGYAGG